MELGSFAPQLIFLATGGTGKVATVTYKCLATLLLNKWSVAYSSLY